MPSTRRRAVIAAPAERVWRVVRDFHDMGWAPGVVTSCEPMGPRPGDETGARRVLNGVFRETLLTLDDASGTLSYRLDDGPSPVSPAEVRDFVARLVVEGRPGGGTVVEWSATWRAADDAACAFAAGIYDALLVDLRRTCESATATAAS